MMSVPWCIFCPRSRALPSSLDVFLQRSSTAAPARAAKHTASRCARRAWVQARRPARQNAKPDTDARQPRAAAVGMCVPSACQGGAAIGLFSAQPRRSQAFRPRVTDLQHPTHARTAMDACQVRWFERMPDREVVELDETDVNPAGCLAGIAPVVFADTREQVCFLAWHIPHGLPGRTRPHFAWHSAGHWPCCIRTRASASGHSDAAPAMHLPPLMPAFSTSACAAG